MTQLALSTFDEKILYFFNRSIKCGWLDHIFPYITDLGLWAVVILIFVIVRYFQEGIVKFPLPAFIVGWFLSDFLSGFLKSVFMRPRPFISYAWVAALEHSLGYSMPSGHAVVAMVYCVILKNYYPNFAWFFYPAAGLIGFSRIYMGVHYPSDVLTGFLIGYILGSLMVKVENRFVRGRHR